MSALFLTVTAGMWSPLSVFPGMMLVPARCDQLASRQKQQQPGSHRWHRWHLDLYNLQQHHHDATLAVLLTDQACHDTSPRRPCHLAANEGARQRPASYAARLTTSCSDATTFT
jgi:hypothetical protein